MSDKLMFSGMNAVDPMELCNALGWGDNIETSDLVGAVMSLCRTVADQQREINELRDKLSRKLEIISMP